MKYAVVFEQGPTSVGATVPDLPGCFAIGPDMSGTRKLVKEVIEFHIRYLRDAGDGVPEPCSIALPPTPGAICTTQEVLTEYLNYFAAWGPSFRRKASVNVRDIPHNEMVRVVQQSPTSFLTGFDLYRARFDKGYSLTDCISMLTMREEGLIEVLTNARHFEQEGLRALFRNP